MPRNLKIDLVEKKNARKHPPVYHAILPQHEFSMLIVAPKGSGKTNFICNLLLKHYKGYFHRVLVCSPTINNDEKWDVVKETRHVLKRNIKLDKALTRHITRKKIEKVVHANDQDREPVQYDGRIPDTDFFTSLDQLQDKLDEQQHQIDELHTKGWGSEAKFLADRLLVILDDQAGMFKGGNFNNPVVNYVIKHRHYSSSCIIVTQAYKAVPKTIRSNCNALILFEIPNLSELKVIYEENPEGLSEKEWMNVYKHCTEKPYAFMYINNKFPKNHRIFSQFNSRMQVKVHVENVTPPLP